MMTGKTGSPLSRPLSALLPQRSPVMMTGKTYRGGAGHRRSSRHNGARS